MIKFHATENSFRAVLLVPSLIHSVQYPYFLQPQEAGTFARASEQVLKQRKIIRARRGGPAEPPAAASANPFANVQLASAPPAAANPFAGIALVAPKPAAAQPEQPRTAAEGTKEAPEEAPEAKTEEQKAVEAEAPKPAALGGFGGFGSGASGGGLAFGSSAAGGFGGVAPASSGFGFLGKLSILRKNMST